MSHSDHIVVDVEIQKTIEETPGGWDSTHLLGVALTDFVDRYGYVVHKGKQLFLRS